MICLGVRYFAALVLHEKLCSGGVGYNLGSVSKGVDGPTSLSALVEAYWLCLPLRAARVNVGS